MNTTTLESQPLSNKVAISSPSELDIYAIVELCARRKADIGQTFQGKKGRQYLFALVCKTVKSMLGQAGKGELLSLEVEEKVRVAIAQFWQSKANILLSYGDVISFTLDKPSVTFDDEMRVTEVKGNCSLKAQRDGKDKHETLLWLHHVHKTIVARLNLMKGLPDSMGIVTHSNKQYSKEEIWETEAKLKGIEQRVFELENSK